VKERFERPLPSDAQKDNEALIAKHQAEKEEAIAREARVRAAFDWILQQENGRIVWAWLFERCGWAKPVLMRTAGGDVAPLSTECLAAQREVYREMRKMVPTPEFLAAVEFMAEFGPVKLKVSEGDK